MENHQHSVWNSTYENDDFLFDPTMCQFSSYDYHWGNANDGYQYDQFPLQDSYLDAIPYPHENFPIEPSPISVEDYGFCDVPSALSEGDGSVKTVFSSCNDGESVIEVREDLKGKQYTKEKSCSARTLSKEKVSEYFYMTISQAARELNVSLTNLKKRCRELGIYRWPRRKLMSLQTLIKDIQEQGKERENDEKIRTTVEMLEKEKRMVEEMPDLQLEDNTRKLRQVCSKANYKKKKLMSMQEVYSKSFQSVGPKFHETVAVAENEGLLEETQVEFGHAYLSRA